MANSTLVLCRPGLSSSAEKRWAANLPLGLGYLAASARAEGIPVSVVDGKLLGHLTTGASVDAILSHRPAYVGISAMTFEYPRAQEIASQLKARSPGIVTILGGVHSNALPADSLRESPDTDFVLTGQSEKALPALVHALASSALVEHLPGLYFRDSSGTVSGTPPVEPVDDISTLPFPAWDLFPRQKAYPVMMERGCPFQCAFCCRNMTRKIRSRSLDHVMQEIEWLRTEFGAEHIAFEDETFGLNQTRAEEFLDRLCALNSRRDMTFAAQTRADCLTPTLARKMRAAGFEYVSLGIESGDDSVLSRAMKGTTVRQNEEAARVARAEGLKIWPKFIIGLPGETRKTALNTIRLAVRMNPERFGAATIVAYPGSQIYEWARKSENGYRLLSNDWARYDKYLSLSVELETLSARMLKWLQMRLVLEVYIRNRRWRELLDLILEDLPFVVRILRSLVQFRDRRARAEKDGENH